MGWRGYISSREIAGQIIPQRVQNLVIRNYTQKNNMLFLLSATEYYMDNCYMMLNSLQEELINLAGLVFYSLDLLPGEWKRRKQLYETILSKECEVHFALEELVIARGEQISLIEDILSCRTIAMEAENGIEQVARASLLFQET
ncbi:LIC12192 family sporadic carbohydrate cluster protein [Lusitaniella coriacea]|uniref:LIC12192 family sporadic carbohydrate cluster protein n=1 Tax=Lusitaniella coriacea TaxID=1983105 RepID=UPI001D15949F|nr:LIC12192 family sporadic carbohydrate cluster protein [Lusitaniella coriacea]